MKPVTATVTMFESTITATVSTTGKVSISADGHWAGEGQWSDMIMDCPAHFGSDTQTEQVYDALDTAIQDAIDETE